MCMSDFARYLVAFCARLKASDVAPALSLRIGPFGPADWQMTALRIARGLVATAREMPVPRRNLPAVYKFERLTNVVFAPIILTSNMKQSACRRWHNCNCLMSTNSRPGVLRLNEVMFANDDQVCAPIERFAMSRSQRAESSNGDLCGPIEAWLAWFDYEHPITTADEVVPPPFSMYRYKTTVDSKDAGRYLAGITERSPRVNRFPRLYGCSGRELAQYIVEIYCGDVVGKRGDDFTELVVKALDARVPGILLPRESFLMFAILLKRNGAWPLAGRIWRLVVRAAVAGLA